MSVLRNLWFILEQFLMLNFNNAWNLWEFSLLLWNSIVIPEANAIILGNLVRTIPHGHLKQRSVCTLRLQPDISFIVFPRWHDVKAIYWIHFSALSPSYSDHLLLQLMVMSLIAATSLDTLFFAACTLASKNPYHVLICVNGI